MEKYLDHLRNEVVVALRATYALQQLLLCLSEKQDAERINDNYQFWMVFESATRSQLFLYLRRIFENNRGTHNFQTFIEKCIEKVHLFSKAEFSKRKLVGWIPEDYELDDFLHDVYEATVDDFQKLSRMVRDNSKGIKARYIHISSKTVAHAVLVEHEDIKALYEGATITEIETALASVWHCYNQVWRMYHNGLAPDFEIRVYPYSHEIKDAMLKQIRCIKSV